MLTLPAAIQTILSVRVLYVSRIVKNLTLRGWPSGLGLGLSSSKPLDSESTGFAFWVELVAPGLPSAGYLSYVVCELLHSGRVLPCAPPKGSGCGFPLRMYLTYFHVVLFFCFHELSS